MMSNELAFIPDSAELLGTFEVSRSGWAETKKSRKHAFHRMRATSLKAYGEVPNLSDMQQMVFNAIIEINREGLEDYPDYHYPTDVEITRHLELFDPNNVRPRRNELMEAGFIIETEKRKCTKSGRLALTWLALPHLKDKLKRNLH